MNPERIYIKHKGYDMSIKDIAKLYGMNYGIIYTRCIIKGMSVEMAVSGKVMKYPLRVEKTQEEIDEKIAAHRVEMAFLAKLRSDQEKAKSRRTEFDLFVIKETELRSLNMAAVNEFFYPTLTDEHVDDFYDSDKQFYALQRMTRRVINKMSEISNK